MGIHRSAFSDDGYYSTGDLCFLDDSDAMVFVGRASEMVKRAGINVSPAEVEDALPRHENVTAAAVVGVADQTRGECIVAFVVASRKISDGTTLLPHCKTILSKHKKPDRIEIVKNCR